MKMVITQNYMTLWATTQIHYVLNYLALWVATQNYGSLCAITIFRNSRTLNIHLLFFIINHYGDYDPDRRQRRHSHRGYQQGLS